MTKHDIQQYAGILVLCLLLILAMTKVTDTKVNNYYAKQYNSKGVTK